MGLLNPLWVTLLAMFLIGVLHIRWFRQILTLGLRQLGHWLWFLTAHLPSVLLKWPPVRLILESRPVQLLTSFLVKPLIPALLIWLPLRFIAGLPVGSLWTLVGLLLAASAFLNTRLGRDVEELIAERISRGWRHFFFTVLPAMYRSIMDEFKRLLERTERVLYAVDEWLRFRTGDSRAAKILKPIIGAVWFFIDYFVRFCATVLLEPQINPIKHFPVVTVSHKIMFPVLVYLWAVVLVPAFGESTASWIFFWTQLLLPGAVGFLVWELRENWNLYAANRPKNLQRAVIGSHGEPLLRLLKPGFHSGTIPGLFTKLRAALEEAFTSGRLGVADSVGDKLHHVRHDLQQFARRELGTTLEVSPHWPLPVPRSGRVELANNRIRLEILPPQPQDLAQPVGPADPNQQALPSEVMQAIAEGDSFWLVVEEQSGWLVASIGQLGWVQELPHSLKQVFLTALIGLYKRGGIHLVREQIEHLLRGRQAEPSGHQPTANAGPLRYDIADRGLIVWPDGEYTTEVVYNLRRRWRIAPASHGPSRQARQTHRRFPTLEPRQFLLSQVPVSWDGWVSTWQQPEIDSLTLHSLVGDLHLLPAVTPRQTPQAKPIPVGASVEA